MFIWLKKLFKPSCNQKLQIQFDCNAGARSGSAEPKRPAWLGFAGLNSFPIRCKRSGNLLLLRLQNRINQTPKIIRAGSCKRCGICCRNITFKIGEDFITTEEEFERLKSWDKKYNHFYISGKDELGIMLFTCKSLREDNLCGAYFFRSFYCRTYPRINSQLFAAGVETLDGCGFYYKVSTEFKDFLK